MPFPGCSPSRVYGYAPLTTIRASPGRAGYKCDRVEGMALGVEHVDVPWSDQHRLALRELQLLRLAVGQFDVNPVRRVDREPDPHDTPQRGQPFDPRGSARIITPLAEDFQVVGTNV